MLAASTASATNAMNRRISTGHTLNPRDASRTESRPQSASSIRSAVIDQEQKAQARSRRNSKMSAGSTAEGDPAESYGLPQMGNGELDWILNSDGSQGQQQGFASPGPTVATELKFGELSPQDKEQMGIKDPTYKGKAGESTRAAVRRLSGVVSVDDVLEDLYVLNMDENRVQDCFVLGSTVIDPRGWWYGYWSWLVIILNIWAATITPYEVVFLPTREPEDILFWVNRVVDLVFVFDILVNLNLGFEEQRSASTDTLAVTDRQRIFQRYFWSGWLLIDFLSVAPFHLIARNFMALRLLRLLRLGKLFQLFEANGTIRVWQVRNGISFNFTELALCFFATVLIIYYLSCFWYLCSTFGDGDGSSSWSWIELWYYKRYGVFVSQDAHEAWLLFSVSVYHGIMTLTTIGYGDVVPSTTDERWFSATMMQLMGAALYAYIIAVASILVGSLHRYELDTQGDADDVTDLCEDFFIDANTTAKSREYLINSANTTKLTNWIQLLNLMSPTLQLQAVQQSLLKMVDTHPAIAQFELAAKVSLCLRFEVRTYGEGELIAGAGPCSEMIFSQLGVCYNGSGVAAGNVVVGVESLMNNGYNRKPCRAMTRCLVLVLSRASIQQTRNDFPISDGRARKWAIKRAFARDVISTIRRLRPAMFDNKGKRIIGTSMIERPQVVIKSGVEITETVDKPMPSPTKQSLGVGPYMDMTIEFKDYLQQQYKLKCVDDDLKRALDRHAQLHLKVRREQQRIEKILHLLGLSKDDLKALQHPGGGTGDPSSAIPGGGVGVGTGQSDSHSKNDDTKLRRGSDDNWHMKLLNGNLIGGSKEDSFSDAMKMVLTNVLQTQALITQVNTTKLQDQEDAHLESRLKLSERLNYPIADEKSVGLGVRQSDALFGVPKAPSDDVPTYFKPKRRKAALPAKGRTL